MHVLECELVTPVSIEETFALFENPGNLAKITPDWLHFEIVTSDLKMKKGTEIEYKLKWHGLPLGWKTLITEYEPPFLFVDVASRSPYKVWRHRHTFREAGQGTLVSDRVEYELPLGFLGEIAHGVAVKNQLVQIFEFRQREIIKLLGGSVSELKRPVVV